MRDGSKRIPSNIPGFGCNTACRTDISASEGTGDVTSNAHSASCKCERTWYHECNC
jgi:hypothetical protein